MGGGDSMNRRRFCLETEMACGFEHQSSTLVVPNSLKRHGVQKSVSDNTPISKILKRGANNG